MGDECRGGDAPRDKFAAEFIKHRYVRFRAGARIARREYGLYSSAFFPPRFFFIRNSSVLLGPRKKRGANEAPEGLGRARGLERRND